MSAPRFDPTAAKALIATAQDGADKLCDAQLYGFAKIVRRLAESLSSAISAIEGPEDGAGEIQEFAERHARAWYPMGEEAEDGGPRYRAYIQGVKDTFQTLRFQGRLATRAPSESAPSDEQITEALRLGPGPAKHEAYARLRALFTATHVVTDEMVERAARVLAADAIWSGYDEETKERQWLLNRTGFMVRAKAALTAALSTPEETKI